MEPQLPKPQLPRSEVGANILPNQNINDLPEQAGVLQRGVERSGGTPGMEKDKLHISSQPVASPTSVTALPQIAQPVAVGAVMSPVTQSGANPIVAGDDDVIEKEWVDRAKQIVNTTKEDPRMQKQEVSTLQADYLEKRYGKTVKLPSSQ